MSTRKLKEPGLRMLLSSWQRSRGFRAIAARHYRERPVLDASETDLNREFENRGPAEWRWFFITLLVFTAIDYFCLHIR
jgi:hypothetical protein